MGSDYRIFLAITLPDSSIENPDQLQIHENARMEFGPAINSIMHNEDGPFADLMALQGKYLREGKLSAEDESLLKSIVAKLS